MLPFFKRTERHHDLGVDREQRGFEGPTRTSSGREYPLREAVRGAFTVIGLKEVEDANRGIRGDWRRERRIFMMGGGSWLVWLMIFPG
jgi:hypothetical protein